MVYLISTRLLPLKRFFVFVLFALGIFSSSCKKNQIESKTNPLAALVVTNAVVSGGNIKLNTNDRDSAKVYNAKLFGLAAGESTIRLFATTGSKTYYNTVQQMVNGGVYSLFLSGTESGVDAVFVKDDLPSYYTDSTVGIRIINLSPNSASVNVTLASATGTNVFSGISYKQLTNFVKLPLPGTIPTGSVTFQVRDAVTNNVLATYTLPTSANSNYPNISILNSRNRNLTLVIKGLTGTTTGNDALGLFPVANY